jgi:hypothetical protein
MNNRVRQLPLQPQVWGRECGLRAGRRNGQPDFPGRRCRRGRPPRNSKWVSLTTEAIESARPSHFTRANWRAESQAALYQSPGLSPG